LESTKREFGEYEESLDSAENTKGETVWGVQSERAWREGAERYATDGDSSSLNETARERRRAVSKDWNGTSPHFGP